MLTDGKSRSESERQKIREGIVAYMPALKRFAISLSGNLTQADDLVQMTLVRGLAHIDSFQSGTNLGAWLFTILRNQFYSGHRKLWREKEWDPKFEDTLLFSTGVGETGAEATHDLHRLLLYLACLSAPQSDALIAIGYLGMSYEEAAERLGCAVGTIKSRVNRARVELAALIEGAVIKNVVLTQLRSATRGVPQSHRYFPIAKAYEELYAACHDIVENGSEKNAPVIALSESDKLWETLVASGVLDQGSEGLPGLMVDDPS